MLIIGMRENKTSKRVHACLDKEYRDDSMSVLLWVK